MAGRRSAPARAVPGGRRRARYYALQALFQWYFSGGEASEIEQQFRESNDFSQVDAVLFRRLLCGVIDAAATLDALVLPLLDRSLKELGGVEHTLLRMGAWELRYTEELPWKVAVDEATTLARTFGATDSHQYINAVLDRLARELGAAPAKVPVLEESAALSAQEPAAEPAKKPARKKPAAEPAKKPVRKKPAAEPAKKPARKKPAAEPAKKPARKKPAAEPAKKPARKKPAAEPAKKPARKKPAAEPAKKPVRKKPAAEPVKKPARKKSV